MDFGKLMEAELRDENGSEAIEKKYSVEDLQKCREVFLEQHKFSSGDIVDWKPGMKNKRSSGPYIVVEVLDAPLFDGEESSGSPYFREPLDIVVGHVRDCGNFYIFHLDSRRLQPYVDPQAN